MLLSEKSEEKKIVSTSELSTAVQVRLQPIAITTTTTTAIGWGGVVGGGSVYQHLFIARGSKSIK